MAMNPSRFAAVTAAVLLLAGTLAGCAGTPDDAPSRMPSPSASSAGDTAPPASETPSPLPSPVPTSEAVTIPDDCRAILSDDVLAQLEGIPLNDPDVGPSGTQADGSLLCVWRDPRADTTALVTKILHLDRATALDRLNALADKEGYTCFTPDGGTRCEKTWKNGTYPVMDGRTLFWRDGVLIDTSFSNLAPTGYTSSIVAHLFD